MIGERHVASGDQIPTDSNALPASPPGAVDPAKPTSPVRHERRGARAPWRALFVIVLVLGAIGGLAYWWLYSRLEVSTDNAYVVGNITPISPRSAARSWPCIVDDNMIVQPGDPIAQIDPVPFQAQVDQAVADSRTSTVRCPGG